MNRRELLQALLVVPGASLLSSCQPSPNDDQKGYSASGKREKTATLKVILQGPFAVVMQKDEHGKLKKITAFVPLYPGHEFRFQMPKSEPQKSYPQYQFVLPPDGLEIGQAPPYIDHGFDDMNFDLGEWQPNVKQYFVTVELPVPELITFIPPSEPVVFEDGKIGFAPLNHVLEYKISNVSKVRLHSEQFKQDQRPLAFSEIYRGYEAHWGEEKDFIGAQPHGPQREHTRENLSRPSEPEVYTLFFGVGVPPGQMSPGDAIRHALDFYNTKLLPSFPKSPALCCKHLKEIRDYGQPCTPFQYSGPATAKPSILDQQTPRPRLRLVTSAEDCRASGLMGTSP